mgnify:CR=1 FL=1
MLNILNFLKSIEKLNYAICKLDVPYMPKNFPIEYPIGKDIDILTSERDFEKIKRRIKEYGYKYKNKFKIKEIEEKKKYKLRFIHNNKLHYQIDCEINNVLIKNRIEMYKDNLKYYSTSFENERKIRLLEVKKYPKKKHHREWLNKYNIH